MSGGDWRERGKTAGGTGGILPQCYRNGGRDYQSQPWTKIDTILDYHKLFTPGFL